MYSTTPMVGYGNDRNKQNKTNKHIYTFTHSISNQYALVLVVIYANGYSVVVDFLLSCCCVVSAGALECGVVTEALWRGWWIWFWGCDGMRGFDGGGFGLGCGWESREGGR